MPKEPSVEHMQKERSELIRCALEGDVTEAWSRVRQHLIDSPSLFTDHHVYTIWEGPTRGWLLPLPFEVLRDFTRRFGDAATTPLVSALTDIEPNVVGYALHALSEIDSQRFASYIPSVAHRLEAIHTIYGSFGWEGTLTDYAARLNDDL